MNTEKFAYWLQGALEMNPEMLKNGMSPEQVQTIQDHLNLIFDKATPDRFNKEGIVDSISPKDFRVANGESSADSYGPGLFCTQFKSEAVILPSSSISKKPGRKPRRRTSPGSKC